MQQLYDQQIQQPPDAEFLMYLSRALWGAPAPTPDNAYGSPGEQSQRVFRTIRGTKGGVRAPGVHKGTPKNPKRST